MIATRNRIKKLVRCLESIGPAAKGVKVVVKIVCDGEMETMNYLVRNSRRFKMVEKIIHQPGPKGAVFCRNMVIKNTEDGVLYATDDMTFERRSILHAFDVFNANFPDEDGVVGFRQIPDNFHPTGVALVGRKFLDRYKNRELFYPGYFHFACQEIHWHAAKVGRFYQDKAAVIRHFHPVFFKEEMDRTHQEARKHKARDMTILNDRRRNGQIWGLC